MILLSHPAATDQVRHVAMALNRAGIQGEFWTCPSDHGSPHSVPIAAAADLAASALADAGLGSSSEILAATSPRVTESVCRSLDETVSARLALEPFQGVYAYEGGAEESFRAAGRRGMLRIYDVASAHWQAVREICAEEAALEPEWAAILDCPAALPPGRARADAELHQADLVIVASTFLLRTFDHVSTFSGTVAVLPRGGPAAPVPTAPAPGSTGKLRALFVGPLVQRKGLSYLFRACRELRGAVSLTVVGPPPSSTCPMLERELRDVRWRASSSIDVIRAELAAHDVLLSPSLCDGFEPILLDALGAGLPVIATPHTAAPDLVDHGVEGFIVPIRSSADIAAKLELLWREPDRRAEMSAHARRRAQRHHWDNYERVLAASIAAALAQR